MEPNNYRVRTRRFEFRVDPDNGYLVGPDECHYDDEQEAMLYAQLGICGCGNPEGNHELAWKVVECFDRDKRGWEYGGDNGTTAVTELVKADPEQAAELLVQLLDKCDLFEHGGSIHGAWLTERGKQFLEIGPIAEPTEKNGVRDGNG